MLSYSGMVDPGSGLCVSLGDPGSRRRAADYLVDVWLRDYRRATVSPDVVQVTDVGFDYLFDVANERLIAAFGFSRGRDPHDRDKGRMAGAPIGGPQGYHRGHAIPHRAGGGTDINLVAQKGSINIGPFRRIESLAISRPGALYFSYWLYTKAGGQRPFRCEQGLFTPGRKPELATFAN
jgi:hypothetical protein